MTTHNGGRIHLQLRLQLMNEIGGLFLLNDKEDPVQCACS